MAELGEVIHGGLSGIAMPIDEVVAEGDRVLVRLRLTGRHTGEFRGVSASGRSVDVAVMDHFRVAGGNSPSTGR